MIRFDYKLLSDYHNDTRVMTKAYRFDTVSGRPQPVVDSQPIGYTIGGMRFGTALATCYGREGGKKEEGAKMTRMTKKERDERKAQAVEHLRTILKPGDTVYTVLKSRARSGMYRHVALLIGGKDGLSNISGYVADALQWRLHDDGALGVSGCGMDVGFEAVYNTASVLFRDGFQCIGEGCPANDHTNGDWNYTPHTHKDGGYALRQRWL